MSADGKMIKIDETKINPTTVKHKEVEELTANVIEATRDLEATNNSLDVLETAVDEADIKCMIYKDKAKKVRKKLTELAGKL